jgi:cytochrome c-type biogenesis protein
MGSLFSKFLIPLKIAKTRFLILFLFFLFSFLSSSLPVPNHTIASGGDFFFSNMISRFTPKAYADNTGATPGVISDKSFYTGLRKVSPETIHQILPNSEGKAIFLEFKSKFCLACKKMDPILERILPEYSAVEPRIFDMMKDKESAKAVFQAFQPSVVPIQVFINTQGEIINVYYDEHNEADLRLALSCIDPKQDGSACKTIATSHGNTTGMIGSEKVSKNLESEINEGLSEGSVLTLALCFLAGILSSFLPCTIAMLPILVGYIGGFGDGSKKDIFFQVSMFILGLASVMTALGIALSLLGLSFGSQNSELLYGLIGVLCIVMALQMMEVIHLPMPSFVTKLPETKQGRLTSFYVLGCAFGLVASPCGTPVLAAILGVISQKGDVLLGGASLFCYALGQGLLLMLAGLFTGLLKYRAKILSVGSVLTKLSGGLIILVGVSFLMQAVGWWTPFLQSIGLE